MMSSRKSLHTRWLSPRESSHASGLTTSIALDDRTLNLAIEFAEPQFEMRPLGICVKALQHSVCGAGSDHASDLSETDYADAAKVLGCIDCNGIRVEEAG